MNDVVRYAKKIIYVLEVTLFRPNMVGCEKITVELIEDKEEYEEELDKSIDKM